MGYFLVYLYLKNPKPPDMFDVTSRDRKKQEKKPNLQIRNACPLQLMLKASPDKLHTVQRPSISMPTVHYLSNEQKKKLSREPCFPIPIPSDSRLATSAGTREDAKVAWNRAGNDEAEAPGTHFAVAAAPKFQLWLVRGSLRRFLELCMPSKSAESPGTSTRLCSVTAVSHSHTHSLVPGGLLGKYWLGNRRKTGSVLRSLAIEMGFFSRHDD